MGQVCSHWRNLTCSKSTHFTVEFWNISSVLGWKKVNLQHLTLDFSATIKHFVKTGIVQNNWMDCHHFQIINPNDFITTRFMLVVQKKPYNTHNNTVSLTVSVFHVITSDFVNFPKRFFSMFTFSASHHFCRFISCIFMLLISGSTKSQRFPWIYLWWL